MTAPVAPAPVTLEELLQLLREHPDGITAADLDTLLARRDA